MALQKLLMEGRADRGRLFWWAFYGTVDTGKDREGRNPDDGCAAQSAGISVLARR